MGFDNTIVHNPNSGYSKEARKWDLPKSQGGMRPDHYEHFPKMIYKARRPDSGGPIRCVDPGNEQFSGSNQLTVRSEAELREALENGWRETPQEAVEYASPLGGPEPQREGEGGSPGARRIQFRAPSGDPGGSTGQDGEGSGGEGSEGEAAGELTIGDGQGSTHRSLPGDQCPS
jgi:hypothetical protein